jgi:hypothetical protein
MSLNPLRALGSASCHRIFKDFDEMERHQSHEMRGVAWFCEISLTPAWLQYAGIPHPTRPLTSSPAPGGGGSRGDTRGKPYPGRILRHWTVGGIASGGGADGEGGKKPPPLSTFNMTVKGARGVKNTSRDLRILDDMTQ